MPLDKQDWTGVDEDVGAVPLVGRGFQFGEEVDAQTIVADVEAVVGACVVEHSQAVAGGERFVVDAGMKEKSCYVVVVVVEVPVAFGKGPVGIGRPAAAETGEKEKSAVVGGGRHQC